MKRGRPKRECKALPKLEIEILILKEVITNNSP
jgi:hypothetical protein